MPDLKKMTVQGLRELARKVLGPGHSRLKTKGALVEALAAAAGEPAGKPPAVKGARAGGPAAAQPVAKPAAKAQAAPRGAPARKAEARPAPAKAAAKPAARPEKAEKAPGKATPARKGAVARAAAAVAGAVGAAVGAAQGAASGVKKVRAAAAARKQAPAPRAAAKASPARAPAPAKANGKSARPKKGEAAPAGEGGLDPEGYFVARVRGEEAVRGAPHPLSEEAAGAAPGEAAPADGEGLGELPWGYGDDAFVALPRDPRSLFLYWDFDPATLERAFKGLDHPRAQLWLYARAPGAKDGWERVRVIEFALESRGYYVHDLDPGRLYRAEIHVVDRRGKDRALQAPSNEVGLPPLGPSPLLDDRFIRIPWDLPLGKLLGSGHKGGAFSEEVRAMLARLSDWSRFAGKAAWGANAGGMGGRPSSPTSAPGAGAEAAGGPTGGPQAGGPSSAPTSPAGPYGPREP